MKHFLPLAILLNTSAAQACLFARDAQPKDWLEWANVLVAAEVTGIAQDQAMDVVRLDVRETFRGPPMAQSAKLEVPSRMWASCKLERPTVGARVLVAINPASDALIVPLSADYAERLRGAIRQSTPAPTSK